MKLSDIDVDRLEVVTYPDPVLREVCAPVEEFGPELEALVGRMLELMREGKGVGLAAPQVGLLLRLFVCSATGESKDDRVCANPVLSGFEGGEEREEGCLSLSEITVPVRRPKAATLTARDVHGVEYTVRDDDLQARVWQHENDHLDGRLILDYMSTQSKLTNARAIKALEQDYRERSKRRTTVKR